MKFSRTMRRSQPNLVVWLPRILVIVGWTEPIMNGRSLPEFQSERIEPRLARIGRMASRFLISIMGKYWYPRNAANAWAEKGSVAGSKPAPGWRSWVNLLKLTRRSKTIEDERELV